MKFYREKEFKFVKELGCEIPKDWEVVRLGEIAEYVKGKKPAKLYEYKKEPQFIPYLTAENIRKLKNIKWCDPADNNIVTVAENEIILIWDGSNAGDVFIGFSGALASTMVKIIPKNEEVFSGYLYYQLKVLSEKYLKTTIVGTGIPHISKKIFVNLLIPLPPLPEQKAIAQILSTVDEAIQKVDEAIEKAERLKKGLMQELLTGKVRVRVEDGQIRFHRENNLRFVKELGVEVPEDWEVVRLGDVLIDIRYGTSAKLSDTKLGVPVLTIPNILSGKIDTQNVRRANISEKEYKNLLLKDGDILIVRTNANPEYIGRCALFENIKGSWIFASYLLRLRPDKQQIFPQYLKWCLMSENVRRHFLRVARTSAGNYNLNIEGTKSVLIPLPPLQEQKAIAQILSTVDKLIEVRRRQKDKLERVRKGLMNLLLTGKVRVMVNGERPR